MIPALLLSLAMVFTSGPTGQEPLSQEGTDRDNVVPQDTVPVAPIAPERAATDQLIRSDLAATFDRIPGLEGVELSVEAGVVSLKGRVLSAGDRAIADSLARGVSGVLYVDNGIIEETSLRMRLKPTLERLQTELLTALSYLPLILVAGVVVFFFAILSRFVYHRESFFRRFVENPFSSNLIRQGAAGGVGLLGILLALELLDATAIVGAILGAAGVAGIAVGFAFRNIAENYLAGIILSIRQPFAPDDYILVEGQEGKVIRLTSRETLLMTPDGNHLRIPNATIFNAVVQNNTRNPLRRFRFDLSVGQSEDLLRVQEIGTSALGNLTGILPEPPPRVVIGEVGDSWVLLRFFAWIDQQKVSFDKCRGEAIRVTKEAMEAAGVTMPAPEYGLRVLEGGSSPLPGGPKEDHVPQVPPTTGPEAGGGQETLVPSLATDLSPDRALDQQIARDREEAMERDLLKGV